MRKFLRAPLLHLALLGAALLWLDRTMQRPPDQQIRITVGVQEALDREFQAREGRPPTADEAVALRRHWITEEALVRQAIALGFHKTDVITRRRLVQTSRWILDRPLDPDAVSEPKLRSYYQANVDKYRTPPRLSLRHVFFRHGHGATDPVARAQSALGRIQNGAPAGKEGDPFMRGNRFSSRSREELSAVFGDAFAERVFSVPVGEWQGPLRSTLGTHLVLVDQVEQGSLPPFETVADAVRLDLGREVRERALQEAVEKVVSSFDVVIEAPEPTP